MRPGKNLDGCGLSCSPDIPGWIREVGVHVVVRGELNSRREQETCRTNNVNLYNISTITDLKRGNILWSGAGAMREKGSNLPY